MATKYDLTSPIEKRVRFFDGQFLQDVDFIDEQRYHLDRERRHNRLLHVAGIAEGFEVQAAGAFKLRVTAGTAIDADGRPLVLADQVEVDLAPETYANQRGVRVLAAYQEVPADQQNVGGITDETRWLEHPRIVALPANAVWDGATPPVTLAQIALDDKGTITVDASVRRYSGVRLPAAAGDPPGLAATAAGPVELSGSLTVDGNLGVGVTASGAKLEVTVATDDSASRPLAVGKGSSSYLMILNSGEVGVGTPKPTARLEVAGDLKLTGDNLVTGALGRVTPLLVRGTGLNHSAARMLVLGSTTHYNLASGRGLTLTILRKSDHGQASTTTYDTHGNATASDQLAGALNALTKDQLGILTSYDAWEANLTYNLRTALRRLGLYKAAVTSGGQRRPYAAIFEGAGSSGGVGKAVEVLYAATADLPFAEMRGWLIDGSFVATGSVPNALATSAGTALAVLADETGNVGIGTTSPEAKLEVRGGKVQLDGDQQLVFRPADTTNNLKLQLWSGYGLGINAGTLFYAANGRHSWRDNGGANERMALTTGADGGLTVTGTGASSFAGSVGIGTVAPGAKLTVSASANHLQLRRESTESAGDKQLFLELYQDDPQNKVPGVYPSIRFHHNNKFWHRIEGRPDGFHFKEGYLPFDGMRDIHANVAVLAGLRIGGVTIGETELRILQKLAAGQLQFDLYNVKQDEYAYAADYAPYDDDRRRVFTWRPKGRINQGRWRLDYPG
jgi:hypothetical protein